MIKTEQLRYLVELDRTNSFHKCAENLYLSQPAISLSIRNLEKELGVTLFTRTSMGVYPTEIGTKIIQQAKEILLHINEIKTQCQEYRSNQEDFSLDTLEIYSIESISSIILPQVLSALQKQFPSATFTFYDDELEDFLPYIAQNPYSVGFHFYWDDDCEALLAQNPTVRADALHPLYLYLATAKTAAFRPKNPIPLNNEVDTTSQIPFIFYKQTSKISQTVQRKLLQKENFQLIFEAPTAKLFNMYISQGLAAGIVPGLGNNKFLSTNEDLAQLSFTPIETERKSSLFLFYNQALPTGLHQLLQQYIKTKLALL